MSGSDVLVSVVPVRWPRSPHCWFALLGLTETPSPGLALGLCFLLVVSPCPPRIPPRVADCPKSQVLATGRAFLHHICVTSPCSPAAPPASPHLQ